MNEQNDPSMSPLEELSERKNMLLDKHREKAVEKRRKRGQRTARENIDDVCDEGSFLEIGSLTFAAQKNRRSLHDLQKNTPADGLIAGIGSVNGALFEKRKVQCAVLSYDYTVLAGTQGAFNHKKLDRLLQMVAKSHIPIIFFVEGGGGRPGDVDFDHVVLGGLDLTSFSAYARLSGKVPRIAIVSGYCFAGNAALAGCSDVIIATENISMGMGGPAMIEGGGLGTYHPSEIGPLNVHVESGVVDIVALDEVEAVQKAKKYLSFFQGEKELWECEDQNLLQEIIPKDRKWAYDIRKVIVRLCDKDEVLELRSGFARNMFTGLVRIGGKPFGIIANDSRHLGGAIDSNASDKAARFMQLCDAFGLPIISLCDAPGFMVGPDHEKTGLVRHTSRMFVTGASLKVPVFTIVIRRGYGLGAMAMAGGGFHESLFTVAWPSGEFGAMGLEGAVQLGYKKELDSAEDDPSRQALYRRLVAAAYDKGKAINAASFLEIDEVIDPADTRAWLLKGYGLFKNSPEYGASHRCIDAF